MSEQHNPESSEQPTTKREQEGWEHPLRAEVEWHKDRAADEQGGPDATQDRVREVEPDSE
jgi:hypothetical protein